MHTRKLQTCTEGDSMKLEWLEAVMAVAKLHSFSEAAETIPCAQSSISRHVRAAEDELNVVLFDRSSKSNTVALTSEGERVLPLIEQLLEDWAALRSATPARRARRQLVIRLGLDRWMFSSSNKGNLISALYLSCPEVQLTLQEVSVEKRMDALLRKEIDAALVPRALPVGAAPTPPELSDAVRCEPVGTQPLSIAFGGPLLPAGRDSITLKELKGLPIIFHTDIVKLYRTRPGMQRHGYFVRACLDSGFEPQIKLVDRELADIKQSLAAQGQGVFPSTIPTGLRAYPGIRYLPVEDAPYSVQYYLLFRTGDHNPAIPLLIKMFRDCFDAQT